MRNSTTMMMAAAATVFSLAACTKGGREDYADDAEGGAAAPAAVQTFNAPGGPDSTAGISRRTGRPASAGDTTSAAGKGTIQTNDNTRSVPGAATGTPPRTP